ncbi:MAG: molecular chaperone HtpG [Bacteroidales bacterium]|nr:molecular chaperone HtpG [Bacteroidales bacterium]
MATKSLKGKIGVTTENIFPVIKQFLYSDHEIFLRELVANAVDATQKLKALASSGEFKGELGELKVSVELDEKKKILKIVDRGIGMTEDEVDRYINQIAFSSAGEFLEKYKDQLSSIIGHFGLGFYSAFMVSKKVTIDTLSWREDAKPVHWSCDGSPEYEMGAGKKEDRGTVITLYLDDDSEEFAAKGRISQLLGKYCKFMPVPVVFGKKTEWKEGKSVETDEDNLINNIDPIWTKAPSDLKDEDYLKFYKELYPMEEEPMFWIHLNVDYPFNLTGVLYFPKIKERMAIDKNKIQLYCNQMFVTDHVDNIVPDFLTLLHGVIDSPDIPLNVSRSYLQSDANVKKISTYITKKVADRLEEIFKEQREQFEQKWDNIKLFIEYGMLSDEKFCERALKFALLKNTDGKYFSLEDYRTAIEPAQTDKDKTVVYLYATKPAEQYSWIEAAKNQGYDVLLMDCELDSHFVGLLESKIEHSRFARVDSDSVGNLIPKEEKVKPEMSEDDKKALDELFKAVLPEGNDYMVDAQNLGETAAPVLITQNEFMRRYREMSALGGGMNFYGTMPDSYNIIVNMENPLIAKIWGERDKDSELLHQVVDLALLGNGMLKGKALADFIARSEKLLK